MHQAPTWRSGAPSPLHTYIFTAELCAVRSRYAVRISVFISM